MRPRILAPNAPVLVLALVLAVPGLGCGQHPSRDSASAPAYDPVRSCAPGEDAVDVGGLERRGWKWIDAARGRSDDLAYRRALGCARAMADREPDSEAAALLRGSALYNLHRFAEAEDVARSLVASRGLAADWALLGDALMEQSRLDEAEVAYQEMMDRRPDAGAYARVAHFRSLVGDLEGARALMRWAARAVSPRTPGDFAWIWSRLADYELRLGDPEAALAIVERALQVAPNSACAQRVHERILKEST